MTKLNTTTAPIATTWQITEPPKDRPITVCAEMHYPISDDEMEAHPWTGTTLWRADEGYWGFDDGDARLSIEEVCGGRLVIRAWSSALGSTSPTSPAPPLPKSTDMTPLQAFYSHLHAADEAVQKAAAILGDSGLYSGELADIRREIKSVREAVNAKWEPSIVVTRSAAVTES